MSTKRILLILALVTLYIHQSSGQANLGISAFFWNGPQSVSYGDSSSYTFVVKNYGPGTINTPIMIYTGVWDSTTSSIDTISIDSTSLAQTILNAGDSAWVSHTQVYDSVNFRIGATVVVIWPSAASATTQNNASYTIYIESTMNLIEVRSPGKGMIYPNPASDKIIILPPDDPSESYVEQVRLSDNTGRLLLVREGTGTLDISELPAGVYFVEIIRNSNARTVYRVIKQEP